LRMVDSVRAGQWWSGILEEGECVEIMTGASVPSGVNAVIMVEHTSRSGHEVTLHRKVAAGENVVPEGSEARGGDLLLAAGTRLDYAGIAVCASVGAARLTAIRRKRVAVLCTGDELVEINELPGPAQIRNSNAYSLAAQIEAAGGEAVILPIARDESEALSELLRRGLEHDLLLISGGVSMGKYDLVEGALAEMGAEFFFTGAKIQPGKPVVFGKAKTYFFGLPGNPVSTMVTFELFVRPMLDAFAGAAGSELRFVFAKLARELRTKTGLTRFLPAQLTNEVEPQVAVTKWQGSGDVVSVARSNCWMVVPPEREQFAAGELMRVLLR